MSTAKFCDLLHSHEVGLRWADVAEKAPERPIFHALLGETLKGFRDDRGWSIQRAVINAKKKKHAALTMNRLRWLEEGKTKFPDQDVLRAVADLYEIDYYVLASDYVAANYGRDLLGQAGTPSSDPHLTIGGSDVPASVAARVRELESRLAQFERLAPEINSVLHKLASIAVAHKEDRAATGAQTGRGRSTRRTG